MLFEFFFGNKLFLQLVLCLIHFNNQQSSSSFHANFQEFSLFLFNLYIYKCVKLTFFLMMMVMIVSSWYYITRLLEKFLEDSNKHDTRDTKRINEATESFIVMVVKMESKLLLMELNFKQVLFKLWNDKILNFLMGKYHLIFSFEKTIHTFIINIYIYAHMRRKCH